MFVEAAVAVGYQTEVVSQNLTVMEVGVGVEGAQVGVAQPQAEV